MKASYAMGDVSFLHRGLFRSEGTSGCAAPKGVLFRASSPTKGILFGHFSHCKGMLFGNFDQRKFKFFLLFPV